MELGLIERQRDKLFNEIVREYGDEYNFTFNDLKVLCEFNKEEWEKLIEQERSQDPIMPKKKNKIGRCKARIWDKDRNDIQCSKSIHEGDFCNVHLKEINKKCNKCSKLTGMEVFHKYRWEVCGRIDEEVTKCFWGKLNNDTKTNIKEKKAWHIFCDEKRKTIEKESGQSISKKLGKMWRDLTDLEKEEYEKKAKRFNRNEANKEIPEKKEIKKVDQEIRVIPLEYEEELYLLDPLNGNIYNKNDKNQLIGYLKDNKLELIS